LNTNVDIRQIDARLDKVFDGGGDYLGILALLRYAREVRRSLWGSILLIGISAVAVMVSARLLGSLVAELITPQKNGVDQVSALALTVLTIEVGAVLAQYLGRLGLARVTTSIAYQVRRELFGKMSRLPMTYFDTQPLGRTLTRLTSDVEGIEGFFSGTLARLLTASIQIVAVLVAMIVTDLRFGSIVVLASLPSIIFTVSLRNQVRHWLRLFKQRAAFLNTKLAEFLNGMPVIEVFGLEECTHRSFAEAAEHHYSSGIKLMTWNSIIRPVTVLLSSLPVVLILAVGVRMHLEGTLEIGVLVAFLRFSERFGSPVRTITQEIQTIQEALTSSERVRQMLIEPEESDVLGPGGDVTAPVKGEVEFRDVWMSYRAEEPVLRGISFAVAAGKKVGIVGATGSGKTTTLSLLAGLYPVTNGTILIDQIDLKQWNRPALRRQLGYVSQDVVIFKGTLRENLLGAMEDQSSVSPERILEACHRSGLAQVMTRFSEGMNTRILDGGENLSMGERQLVAFTRMLIKDPAILILDEATANIDEECERLIQESMDSLLKGRTSFIIAHRLSTILSCDLILVFENGKIIESGSHADLLANEGHYAALVRRQIDSPLARRNVVAEDLS